jgi:betaine-aldehyde dehydrogenase
VVSAFSQAGQAGWGVRLCYVAREIEDEFHRRVVDLARSLEGRLARHDDHCRWVGPVRSTADVARLQSCVIKATQSGAKLLTGGGAGDARRRWYPPTVIARVAENDPLVEHGPQGPILATRVFDGEADLLTSVDSVEWVSLWSRNVRRARQWADNLAVGCVCINGRVRGEWDAVDHASVERALDEYVSRRRTIVTPTRHADACDLSVAKARAKAFRRFAS